MRDNLQFDDYRNANGDMDWERYYADLRVIADEKRRTHRDRLTKAFDQFGLVQVCAEFSGGNDQGGADSYAFFVGGEDGPEAIDGSKFHYVYSNEWDPETKQWVNKDMTPEQQSINDLLDIIEEPLQDRWGSWAGDFWVDGTLTYDLSDPNSESYYSLSYRESSYEDHYEEV